jgi:Sulfotransferase family
MSHAVIITGMHRSGTSLVSSLLQHAGVHIGERLIAANSANPRGYFEDVDFYEYQESLLHARGQTYLHVDSDFAFEPTEPERERALKLITKRSHRPVWGWKDPRTSLFLHFWKALIPEARFLFVYRHPIEVLLSLLRRGEFDSHPALLAGVNAWHTYNAKLQSFFDQQPGRCVLVHIDGVVKHSEQFAHVLREKLQLNATLNAESLAQIYHSNELSKTPYSPELTATLTKVHPQLLDLYQQLEQKADLRGDESEHESPASQELSELAHFGERLTDPVSEPVKHSLVQMLLSSLAPEHTSRMLDRFTRSTRVTQQKIDYLWLEVQRLQRVQADQSQELQRVHQLNTEHIQELERIQRLSAEQNRELERMQLLNTEQSKELLRQQQINANQHEQLVRAQQLTAEYSQEFDRLVRMNLDHSHELYCQAVRVETLVDELTTIRNTRVWKAMQSYERFKARWKKAA